MSPSAESYYGPRHDPSILRAHDWNRKRKALKAIHKMYLEDIEEGSLDDCYPMTFAELVETEMRKVKELSS